MNSELKKLQSDMQDLVDINQQIKVQLHKMDNPLCRIESNVINTDNNLDDVHHDLHTIKPKSWWKNEIVMVIASSTILLTTLIIILI